MAKESCPAVSLWQPWASLIAVGAKTIETRSWPAPRKLWGSRIAIHAAKRRPTSADCQDVGDWQVQPDGAGGWSMRHVPTAKQAGDGQNLLSTLYPEEIGRDYGYHVLPLGAVVATCTLVECVPMERLAICIDIGEAGWGIQEIGHVVLVDPDQLPYGDYGAGRWAWLLTDIEPLSVPAPAKGKQGVWTWIIASRTPDEVE